MGNQRIVEEIILGMAAMYSVPNFSEMKEQAQALATKEYEGANTATILVYEYIMDRYTIGVQEMIELFLTPSFFLKIARKNADARVLIEYLKADALEVIHWFCRRETPEEAMAYNYFTKLYENAMK